MRFLFVVWMALVFPDLFAQDEPQAKPNLLPPPMINVDSLYREDQFYAGFTYNRLLNRPTGISQNKFSAGFTAGFQRDMPFNKARTWAFAAGVGVSYNKYFHNMLISKVDEVPQYNLIAPGVQYQKNKFEQVLIDVPLEIRWRTSTPQSHKFWRIYSGVRVSYAAFSRSKYVDDQYNVNVADNKDFNRLQVGAYLIWGYNTWNFYGYYGITPFFAPAARLDNDAVGMNPLHLGLMFYIL